jgi:hypothetical protein
MKRATICLLLSLVAPSALAQTEIAYSENFERYAAQSEPAAWLDSSAGRFTTFDDPLVPGNIVYGAKHPSPRQRSVYRRPPGDVPDLGAYSTLSGRTFALSAGFELRGRFLRATDASLVGVTFFSSQPEANAYRLLALWRTATDTAPTMRLYRADDGVLIEHARGTLTPAPMTWYRFIVRAEGARIRVRVWPDGSEEPRTWDLEFADGIAGRTRGRIGLWSAVGAAYFDDLSVIADAEEEVDVTAPAIVFSESGDVIAGSEAFNREVRVDVKALDASGIRSLTVTADGKPYAPGDPIAGEGTHLLRARAVDTKGNARDAEVTLIVDKSAPAISIAPIAAFTNQNVKPTITVTDLTQTTETVTLDGAPFTSGTVVDAERSHTLIVTAEDAVGWQNSATVTFTIDRTAPLIAIASIPPFTNQNVTPAVSVNEPATVAMTLNGAAYNAGTVVSDERAHALAVTATDLAGNIGTATVTFTIDRTKPVVTIAPIADFTKENVTPAIAVNEPASVVATLNGAAFNTGATVSEEREHALSVIATDAAGNTSTASVTFTIDRTSPAITIAPIAEFTNQDVTPVITVDEPATIAATLNGAAFTAGAVVSDEGAHALAVTATDRAGNIGTASVAFTIDRTKPVVTIAPIAEFTKENVTPAVAVNEPASVLATLNGVAFSTGATVSEEREHTLSVIATDAAGNTSSASITFTIDRTSPTITIAPIAEFTKENVTPAITVNEPATIAATLNGTPFTSGAVVTEERGHVLAVTARDRAGNVGAASVTFTIDRTQPVVTIAPIAPLTNQTVTPGITVNEPATIVATLNGAAFTTGTTIAEERDHALAVTPVRRPRRSRSIARRRRSHSPRRRRMRAWARVG